MTLRAMCTRRRFPKDLRMSFWPLSTIYKWSLLEIPLPAEKGLSNLGSVPLRAGSLHPGPCPGKTVRSGPSARANLPPAGSRLQRDPRLFLLFKANIPAAGMQSRQRIACFTSCNLPFTAPQAVTAFRNASLCTDSGTGGGTRPLWRWQPPRAGPCAAHGAAGNDDTAGGTAGTTGQSGAVQKPVPHSQCHAHTQDEGPSSSMPP